MATTLTYRYKSQRSKADRHRRGRSEVDRNPRGRGFSQPHKSRCQGIQKVIRVIVRLKKAHEFAQSPLKEREMLGIWPGQSVFVINSGMNPTVLTEFAFRS
jgi:hypothetical protein